MELLYGLEYERLNQRLRGSFILYGLVFGLFVSFFHVMGFLDKSEENFILSQGSGVVSLSLTICLSLASIYTVIRVRQPILDAYLGNNRIRTYSFALGREDLLGQRLRVLKALLFRHWSIGTIAVLAVFAITRVPVSDWLLLLLLELLALELAWLQIILSLASGYRFQSGTVSVITSLIFVIVTGNAFAWSFRLSTLVLFCLLLFLYVASKGVEAYFLNKI